ncbi:MAG: hypothetical protein ABR578_05985 [Chromatocurvus sp.]
MARIFESGDQARDAAEKLKAAGFDEDSTFVMAPPTPSGAATSTLAGEAVEPAGGDRESDEGGEMAAAPTAPQAPAEPAILSAEELVEKVRPAGDLEITRAWVCVRALEKGKSLVVVGAYYGNGLRAHTIMDSSGALPAELLDAPKPDNPSPFSDFIGIPCLERRLSFLSGDNPLKDSHWTLFPVKLKNKLTFNSGLTDNPAWLSSKLGMKTLTENKQKRTSFGFKLLTNQRD